MTKVRRDDVLRGFFFVGVPARIYLTLPRFAWVGGSIWGAYAGALLGLLIASLTLHLRWRRMQGGDRGFTIVPVT